MANFVLPNSHSSLYEERGNVEVVSESLLVKVDGAYSANSDVVGCGGIVILLGGGI